MGGFRSFFDESKFFQLVIEEGGRYFSLRRINRTNFHEFSFYGYEYSSMADNEYRTHCRWG